MADISTSETLTPAQHKAISALLSEPSVRKAAEVAGVKERTVYNWLKTQAFSEEYRSTRREATQQAIARLQQYSGHAAATLVQLMASGNPAAMRKWEIGDTDALDRALSRCNAALVALVPRLCTIEDVDAWVRGLPDPDTLDDDEVIAEAHWGLTKLPDCESVLSFGSGTLKTTLATPGSLPRYWGRIAERAGALLKARGLELFPLTTDDSRAGVARFRRADMPAAL